MMSDIILLPQLYLPSISYFSILKSADKITIEKHENFVKSTGRNRAYIAGPNGKLRLSIPIKGGKSQHSRYTDIEIDNDQNWQHLHWRSFCSCYQRSPFFEYYEDHFHPFYHQSYDNLFDYNLELFQLLIGILDLEVNFDFTNSYVKDPVNMVDLRLHDHLQFPQSKIHPSFKQPNYQQVFQDKTGFLPNLSIVDLIFNEGPNAESFI